ncbi:hypothetical protein [Flagellimonas abyssi]|uniref:DUF4393 domain-containing protein n=1 Tax=Flagellimonas abyssi TaxID=2864871 RepID=A0ABS7EL38_9FLAO|nr:hypothetical protein [Allomuricauda abyssi]MBW8198290.1 hypothetical protein [Allomuricauda abyssi]
MEKPENPNKKLELVIKDSDLPSLSKDFAEVAIDGIMDEGVLQDLPLVGGIVGAVKFGNSINKYLSAKKIYKFLFELHTIPQEQRIKKIDEINNSRKYQSSVGEMIFELLEKIESDGKPEILGKLFKAVIEEKIDYETYLRLAHIVKRLFYYDLVWLKNNSEGLRVNGRINDELYTSGLITQDLVNIYEKAKEMNKDRKPDVNDRSLTYLGDMLISIGMK